MGHLSTSWRHVRRYPYQAFTAILIMTLTFFFASVFSFLVIGSSGIIAYFESKPQVTAFFKEEAKQEDIDSLKDKLEQSGKVASTKFVSKEEALKIYQEQNKDDPLLLELVTADILPPSLEIAAVKITDLSSISERLRESPIVREVVFQKDVVATLTSWTSAIRKIGVVLVVVLSLVSIAIMATIIGMGISQKREEIEVVRLLGATGWYVRWPFIFEGVLYSVSGAIFGWGIASLGLWYAHPFLSSFLRGIPLFLTSPQLLLAILGGELLLALFLGTFASFVAVLRYLK